MSVHVFSFDEDRYKGASPYSYCDVLYLESTRFNWPLHNLRLLTLLKWRVAKISNSFIAAFNALIWSTNPVTATSLIPVVEIRVVLSKLSQQCTLQSLCLYVCLLGLNCNLDFVLIQRRCHLFEYRPLYAVCLSIEQLWPLVSDIRPLEFAGVLRVRQYVHGLLFVCLYVCLLVDRECNKIESDSHEVLYYMYV